MTRAGLTVSPENSLAPLRRNAYIGAMSKNVSLRSPGNAMETSPTNAKRPRISGKAAVRDNLSPETPKLLSQAIMAIVKKRADAKKSTRTLSFGTAEVKAEELPLAEIAQKAELSSKILAQALDMIAVPGVALPHRRGVPLYSAVPSDPAKIRQKLNGKVEIGILVNGEFQATG